MFNMNATMPSNHHISFHVMSNSPETNSTECVEEKRGRVAWPVEEIKQKKANKYHGYFCKLSKLRSTHSALCIYSMASTKCQHKLHNFCAVN